MRSSGHPPTLLLVGCRPRDLLPSLPRGTAVASPSLEIERAVDVAAAVEVLRTQHIDLALVNAAVRPGESPLDLARLRAASPTTIVLPLQVPGADLAANERPPSDLNHPEGADPIHNSLPVFAPDACSDPCGNDAALFRDTLEALTYPFYVVNVDDYTLAAANPAAVGSPGLVPSEGLTCHRVTHRRETPCSGEDHPCPLQEVAASGEPVTVEHIHYDADGGTRHVEVHGYPIFGEDGTLVQMIEYTWDITERRKAEEALRRERDLVAQLMETSPVSITMVNRGGEITFANARAENVLGLSKAEITTRTYNAPDWRITDVEGGPFDENDLPFRRVMSTQQHVYDVRHAIEWPDGRRRILSVNGAPLLDPSGEVERVVFAIDDITERVKAEQERIEQIENELRRLDDLAGLPGTAVSARAFGMQPLRETLPHVFETLVASYALLLDEALDRQAYRLTETDVDDVRVLAERLGALGATPRDVVDVHVAALRGRSQRTNPVKAKAYATEGRLVALRLMGELVSYYRKRCVTLTPRTGASRRESATDEGTVDDE